MAQLNMRGKLKKDPAPSLIKYINQPGIDEDKEFSYQTYLDLNKAHVVMCAKQGIIDKDSAKIILKVTKEWRLWARNQPSQLIPRSKACTST